MRFGLRAGGMVLLPVLALSALPAQTTVIANVVPGETHEIANANTKVVFKGDADVGVRVDRLARLLGGNAVDFVNAPPPFPRTMRGIWEIHGTHNPADNKVEAQQHYDCSDPEWLQQQKFCVRPNAREFRIEIEPDRFRFIWPRIPIPNALPGEATLHVTVTMQLSPNDRTARWWIKVMRNAGLRRASIDEVHFPILYLKGPISTRYVVNGRRETEKEAQARARILVPNNNINVGINSDITVNTSLLSANMSVDYWYRTFPNDMMYFEHPNPGQLLQFQAMYIADPGDPGYRNILYLGSQDTVGHRKKFAYKAVSFAPTAKAPGSVGVPLGHAEQYVNEEGHLTAPATDSREVWRWEWHHVYLPAFDLADSPGPPYDEWGNTFDAAATYPVVIGTMKAKTDHFWYDVAEYYRDFVESSGMVGPTFENNPNIGNFKRAAVFTSHSRGTPTTSSILPRALEISHAYKLYIDDAAVPNPNAENYAFVGNYRDDFVYGYLDYDPVNQEATGVDPYMPTFMAQANALGIHVSGYTEGLTVRDEPGQQWPLPASTWLYDRDGNRVGEGQPFPYYKVDYGRLPAAASWFVAPPGSGPGMNGVGHLTVLATGFRGLYIDGLSGSGFPLGYPDPQGLPLMHAPHGGAYGTLGKQQLFDNARAMLEALNPGRESNVYVMSETAQEYYPGKTELVQQGIDYVPYHLAQFEPTFFEALGATSGWDIEDHMVGVPLTSRAWSIPLWNIVYHEYQPANTIVMPITTSGLDTGPLYGPGANNPGGFPGVTAQEWADVLCFAYAATWVAGSKPTIIPYFHTFDHSPISVVNGNVVYDTTHDPSRACDQALLYIRRMHAMNREDWAGRFNLFGQAKRPLYESALNAVRPNVTHPSYTKTDYPNHGYVMVPAIESPVSPLAQFAHAWDHDIPAVLHSVWKYDNTGVVPTTEGANGVEHGILLANWTGSPQTWLAGFDPTLYDVTGSYTVREVGPGGVTIQTIASGTAPNPTAISLTLPPRSAKILIID